MIQKKGSINKTQTYLNKNVLHFIMKNIKEKLLSIAIAIVLVFFIAYGINTFYKYPRYNDFCEDKVPVKQDTTEEECLAMGGKWTQERIPTVEGQPQSEGFCDPTYTCRQQFEYTRENYNKIVFIISAILGLAAVIIGGIVLKLESVSTGIMGGGILTITYGTLRYWGNLEDIGRFLILGIILVVLIFIGYKYLKK